MWVDGGRVSTRPIDRSPTQRPSNPRSDIIGSESRADKRRNSRDGATKEGTEGRQTEEHATAGPASHATTTTNQDRNQSRAATTAAPADTRASTTDRHRWTQRGGRQRQEGETDARAKDMCDGHGIQQCRNNPARSSGGVRSDERLVSLRVCSIQVPDW